MGEATIGIIIQTAIFLFGGVVLIIRNDVVLKSFQKEVSKMQKQLETLADVITKQAVQDERLTEQSRRMGRLEQRVEDMRRGRGFVTRSDQDAQTVDREYP
jgi:hypothetical protein